MKGLYAIGIILVLATTINAEWSSWEEFGNCSRPCGGGLANKTRTCLGATHTCIGTNIRFKTCNTQACTGGEGGSLGEIQCQSYNNVPINDNYFHWVPHQNQRHPCVLYCRTVETGFVLKMQSRAMNGTTCKHQGRDGVCIAGKCMRLGCDGIVGSKRKLDSCGVCGGDGKSCDHPRDHHRRHASRLVMAGKFYWVIVWAACSKSCGSGVELASITCQERSTGDHVTADLCADTPQPSLPPARPCKAPNACRFRWHAFKWGSCSRSCGDGHQYRRVLCVKDIPGREPKHVNDRKCSDVIKPDTKSPCNKGQCPEWLTGPWSHCSVTCGYGEQKRKVVCGLQSADKCTGAQKPNTRQRCFSGRMCEGEAKSYQQDDSSATRYDFFDDARLQDMFTIPRFEVSQWGGCSVTCGVGYRHRNVTCMKGSHVLPLSQCDGSEPHSKKECRGGPCPASVSVDTAFAWQHKNFKSCSQTCGKGVQSSMLECVDMRSNRTVIDILCDVTVKPEPITRYCARTDCPPAWKVSEYSACSVPCGGGRQTRDVTCIQTTSDGGEMTVPVYRCPDPVPLSERSCNLQFCQAQWSTGPWGECSVTCGLGFESRSVFCVKMIKSGLQVNVSDPECFGRRPPTTRQCHFGECYKVQHLPQIREHKGTFIQIKRSKRIKLMVGETAWLLPNQAVKIKCPVRNFHKKLIFWSKDHRIIPLVGRVRVSSNGALRISRASPKDDAGVYTCSAGTLHATVNVTFHSKKEAKEKQIDILDTIFLENFNHSVKVPSDSVNSLNRPQSDTNFQLSDTKYFRVNAIKDQSGYDYSSFTTSDWSPCSVQCGQGKQTRLVTCHHVTDKYIRVLPEEECLRKGMTRPVASRDCVMEEECAKWVTGNWSECTADNCRKEGYAAQTRSVTCRYSNGTVTGTHVCRNHDAGSPPASKQLCKHTDCMAVWTTTRWSECTPACGVGGTKHRALRCEWVTSNKPARFACRVKARPAVSKPCKIPLCSLDVCQDSSSYCGRIERMKMCRYTAFRRKCCRSCLNANISMS